MSVLKVAVLYDDIIIIISSVLKFSHTCTCSSNDINFFVGRAYDALKV